MELDAAPYTVLSITNKASGGSIGSAASTIDIYRVGEINQTTTDQVVTFATPTSTTVAKYFTLVNIGTTGVWAYKKFIAAGTASTFMWSPGASAWKCTNHVQTQMFAVLSLPVGKARTFTGTTNGAFTLGGALANGIAKGYLYFDTNTLNASQPAGFYYVEMSSTTDGIAYNNTYTPAAGVMPTEPGSKTAFSGAVPGGAGFTGAITYMIAQIPAGILGSTGRIISTALTSQTNNANSKSISVVLGATTVGTWSLASTAGGSGEHRIQSHSAASQSSAPTYVIGGQAANTVIVSTEDTSAAINVTYTLTAGTATDSMVIRGQTTAIEVLS